MTYTSITPHSAADSKLYSAPELADEFSVTPRALRFYETKGLLTPRRVGARRVYGHRDRARLALILRGKRLGFSLAEIRDYLELYDTDPGQTSQLRGLAGALRRRICDLRVQQQALLQTLAELQDIFDQTCQALRERGIDPEDTVDQDLKPNRNGGRERRASPNPKPAGELP